MIQAVIFDLDGTLVQTERLKAISYARAAIELRPGEISESQVIEAFKEVVGLSRQEVAVALMQRLGLEEPARKHMDEFGVTTPWQAYVQVRLRIYETMLADPKVLQSHQWPYTVSLLHKVRQRGYPTGLATMSYCTQVQRVLEILNLSNSFDFVASRDDVEHSKPNPEIYLMVARELAISPAHCLVIEDSPAGVKAALAAGMSCIAVTTPFTRQAIHTGKLLDNRWIVDDPGTLLSVVEEMIVC